MGDRAFVATVEGHLVRVDVGPLAELEAMAAVDVAAFVIAALVALAVAGWGARRASKPPLAVVAAAAVLGAALLFGAAAYVFGGPEVSAGALGSPLRLFPELRQRFEVLGRLPVAAIGIGLGTLAGALADVPAWLERRFVDQSARAAAAVVAIGLGIGALLASHGARAHAAVIADVGPLPQLEFDDVVPLHVRQTRRVAPSSQLELGTRSRRTFFFIWGPGATIRGPGSAEDLAKLDRGEHRRVHLSDADLGQWLAGGRVPLEAPAEPGLFEVPVVMERGPVRVETRLTARAIADDGDPLFPLETGTRRVFARAVSAGGTIREDGRVVLEATREDVVEGFRQLTVRITRERAPGTLPPPPAGASGEASGEASGGVSEAPAGTAEILGVVPWEGHYLLAARPDAERFVRPASAEPEGGAELAATPCFVEGLGTCSCSARPVPAGPVRCAHAERHTDHVGNAILLGLGILTAGITLMAGATPRDGPRTVTELRLVERDGVAVDVPSRLTPEPATRRRRRR